MKKNHVILIVFFALAAIISCQKELSKESSGTTVILPPPPLSILDSNYIDTVYEFETRNGVTDTTAYNSYKYDAQKRVVSINWEFGDFQFPYQDSGKAVYFYNGTDTLPYQSVTIADYNGMLVFDTTITFYFYDNAARLIKDSVVDAERDISYPYYRLRHYVELYSYASGKVFRQSSDLPIIEPSPAAYPPTFTLDTVIVNAALNPVSAVSYVSLNNNSSFSKYYETANSYDNNPNPYYKLNISKSFSPIPVADGPSYFTDFIGKNNCVINYTNYPASGSNSTTLFTNVYLPNTYIKKTSLPANFNPAFTDGYLYTYKAL